MLSTRPVKGSLDWYAAAVCHNKGYRSVKLAYSRNAKNFLRQFGVYPLSIVPHALVILTASPTFSGVGVFRKVYDCVQLVQFVEQIALVHAIHVVWSFPR